MFKITKNDDKVLEIKNITFSNHPSVLSGNQFDEAFTREYARKMWVEATVRIMNNIPKDTDEEVAALLENEFGFSRYNDACFTTVLHPENLHSELHPLFILTLIAHGLTIAGLNEKTTDDGETVYDIKRLALRLEMDDFYHQCKNVMPAVSAGNMSEDTAIEKLKPLYRTEASRLINHAAVDGVCKAWKESIREKDVRNFIAGMRDVYKLTSTNRMQKNNNPLRSLDTFEKYVAGWLVYGEYKHDKNGNKNAIVKTFASACGTLPTKEGKKPTTKATPTKAGKAVAAQKK